MVKLYRVPISLLLVQQQSKFKTLLQLNLNQMLITHALKRKSLKSQTPLAKKSISKIYQTPNISNKKVICRDNNKQNQNPNASVKQKKQCNKKCNQSIKQQVYVKHRSPMKKILFVKNLCYRPDKQGLNKQKQRQKYLKVQQYSQQMDISKKQNELQCIQNNIKNSQNKGNGCLSIEGNQNRRQKRKSHSSSSQNLLFSDYMDSQHKNYKLNQKLQSSQKKQKDIEGNSFHQKISQKQFKRQRRSLNDIGNVKIQNLCFKQQKALLGDKRQKKLDDFNYIRNNQKQSQFQVQNSLPQNNKQFIQISKFHSQYWSQGNYNQKNYCRNHPQKEAKFKLDLEQDSSFYCSKCAVFLVTQGGHITQNLSHKNNRLQVIKNLLFQIDKLQPEITECLKATNIIKMNIHEQFVECNKQITNYYQNLIKTVIRFSEQSQVVIKIHYQTFKDQIQKIERSLLAQYNDLCYIRADISPNIDLITNQSSLSQGNFSQIIYQHQVKLEAINLRQNSIRQNQISYHICNMKDLLIKRKKDQIQRYKLSFEKKTVSLSNYHQQTQLIQECNNELMKYSFGCQQNGGNLKAKTYAISLKSRPQSQEDFTRLSFGRQKNNQLLSPTFKII